MLIFWEKGQCSAKELGERLYLDSGTLTPVLKSLEKKGLIKRARSSQDERLLVVEITAAGQALKEQASAIPAKVGTCINLVSTEAQSLYQTLYKLLGQL